MCCHIFAAIAMGRAPGAYCGASTVDWMFLCRVSLAGACENGGQGPVMRSRVVCRMFRAPVRMLLSVFVAVAG